MSDDCPCEYCGVCEPIDAHIAMSLYQYNINSFERADKIFQHFSGQCYDMIELVRLVDSKHWATEMPQPTAKVYLQHALDRYRDEARERRRINA